MNKELALKDAERKFRESLRSIEIAQEICDKIDSLLPANWHSEFLEPNYLTFRPIHSHKASSAEFRMACDLVEKVIKRKLDRHASGDKNSPRLVASNYGYFENDIWLSIWVESDVDDTCKITFKRTWETKAIASEDCLGLSRVGVK